MSVSEKVYNLKSSLPNKLLQDDGTITDIGGNPVVGSVKEYDNAPALPNKFMNPDGTYSTLNEIINSMIDIDIFIVVDTLPDTGEDNKIYLVPNSSGTFDEYYWTGTNWDKIGELNMTGLATTEQVQQALTDAKAYADQKISDIVPLQAMDDYPSIVRDGTTDELFQSIQALNLPVGSMLLGICQLSDLDNIAESMEQEEVKVEVYNNNVLHGVMTSTNVAPYEWTIQYTSDTSIWRPSVTTDVVQNMIDQSVTDVLGGEF